MLRKKCTFPSFLPTVQINSVTQNVCNTMSEKSVFAVFLKDEKLQLKPFTFPANLRVGHEKIITPIATHFSQLLGSKMTSVDPVVPRPDVNVKNFTLEKLVHEGGFYLVGSTEYSDETLIQTLEETIQIQHAQHAAERLLKEQEQESLQKKYSILHSLYEKQLRQSSLKAGLQSKTVEEKLQMMENQIGELKAENAEMKYEMAQLKAKDTEMIASITELTSQVSRLTTFNGFIEVRHVLDQFRSLIYPNFRQNQDYDEFLSKLDLSTHFLSETFDKLKLTKEDLQVTQFNAKRGKSIQQLASEHAHSANQQSVSQFITAWPEGKDKEALKKVFAFVYHMDVEHLVFGQE
jgi:hypothetical protein